MVIDMKDIIERYKGNYITEMRKDVGHAPLMVISCGVIIENEKGEILLQKRRDNGLWAIIGGSMEIGEKFIETVKREAFEKVEGFDENLVVAFNDVDLCLKIGQLGKRIVYNPFAELYHHESKSRGEDNTTDKIVRFNRETGYFEEKWKKILTTGDPYFNKNFAIDQVDCSLC